MVEIINVTSKKIMDKLKISDRVSKLTKKDCYITIKDHKSDFEANPTTRIINPTQPEIGKISKKRILERVNKQRITWD